MTTPSTCHIMCDIESLGTRVGSVVLSVAFVRFEDHASLSLNLNVPEQQALGLEINPATVEWWRDPSRSEAWAAATTNAYPLSIALPHIAAWIAWAQAGRPLRLWCHGASFDAPLLQDVYRAAGLPIPWHYRDVRDTRTLYDLAGVDLSEHRDGSDHVALVQTRAAQFALSRLAEGYEMLRKLETATA